MKKQYFPHITFALFLLLLTVVTPAYALETEADSSLPSSELSAQAAPPTEELFHELHSVNATAAAPNLPRYETEEDLIRETASRIDAAIKADEFYVDLRDLGLSYEDDIELVRTAFARALYDNPERIDLSPLFYISSSGVRIYYVTLVYSEDHTAEKEALFEAAVSRALACVTESMSDLEKALVIHDYLAVLCEYNWEIATGQDADNDDIYTAYGCLVNEDAVCAGYASAYKLLLNRLGIPCLTVNSTSMNHAWNLVELDGKWYHVDVTWDDPVPNAEGYVRHNYFLLSDTRIAQLDHYGWDPRAACESSNYETGWAFNETDTPFYYFDDTFYYLKEDRDSYHTNLYSGTLEEEYGQVIVSDLGSCHRGIVWAGGCLYYAEGMTYRDLHIQIVRMDLTTGESVKIGEKTPFEKTSVTEYPAAYDEIGLRLSDDGSCIEAVSTTRRKVLSSVQISGQHVSISGFDPDSGTVTVSCGAAEGTSYTVLVAFYRDGRFICTSWTDIEVSSTGILSLNITEDVPDDYSDFCIMLVNEAMIPQCQAYH